MELTSEAAESITLKVQVGARVSVSSTRLAFDVSEQSPSKNVYISSRVVTLQLTWSTFPQAL
jgi:hypothetical protein